MSKRYIDVAESAKMIREVLKRAFPGVKFSVKSSRYAGGASITVSYLDGPAVNKVREVTDPFSGAGFDGMIDMQYYKSSYILSDGSVVHGKSDGTYASRGTSPAYVNHLPGDAEEVRFGSDYVHVNRDYSNEFVQKATEVFNETHGPSKMFLENTQYGLRVRSVPSDYITEGQFSRFIGERSAE